MKITLVRLSVFALALTGFSASTVVSYSQTRNTQVTAPHPGYVCGPVPMCPPSSGGAQCGW